MVGAEVIFAAAPLFPPLPPAHPRINTLDKKIAASTAAFECIARLGEDSAAPYLTAREVWRQTKRLQRLYLRSREC
jgi:hypothetical protein